MRTRLGDARRGRLLEGRVYMAAYYSDLGDPWDV